MTTNETRTVTLTPAALIKSSRQQWLWQDVIPLGTACIFAGRGGEGKSSFALHLTGQLNAGTLEGDLLGTSSPVIIVGPEDDWATVMKPRLVAAGANLDQVWKLAIATTVDEVTRETVPVLPLDVDRIREAIIETGARMVVLDPATSLMAGDMNKREDVRRSLDALLELAQDTSCTLVLIMHFGKGIGNVSEKISGSHALRDAARSVLLFATDEDTEQRIVTLDKSNYSRNGSTSFAFNLIDAAVDTDDGDTAHVAKVIFLGATELSVSDIVNRSDGDDDDRSEAERWLIGYLEDHGGSAPAGDIRKAALSDGLEWRTVQKWSRKVADKKKSGFQGQWLWSLDLGKGAPKDSKGARVQGAGTFGTFGENVTPLHSEQVS
jgi:hypothetical protein